MAATPEVGVGGLDAAVFGALKGWRFLLNDVESRVRQHAPIGSREDGYSIRNSAGQVLVLQRCYGDIGLVVRASLEENPSAVVEAHGEHRRYEDRKSMKLVLIHGIGNEQEVPFNAACRKPRKIHAQLNRVYGMMSAEYKRQHPERQREMGAPYVVFMSFGPK